MTEAPTLKLLRLLSGPLPFRPLLRRDPCSYCHQPHAGTLDHIRARRRISRKYKHGGGTNTIDNLTSACPLCNHLKDDRPLLMFLATHGYPVRHQPDAPYHG